MSECEHCFEVFERLYVKDELTVVKNCPWCRIAELESLITDIHDKLYDGEIYGWDDGSDEWQEMRVIARKALLEVKDAPEAPRIKTTWQADWERGKRSN